MSFGYKLSLQKENYTINCRVNLERYGHHTRTIYEDIEIDFNGILINGDDLNERNYLRILNELSEG